MPLELHPSREWHLFVGESLLLWDTTLFELPILNERSHGLGCHLSLVGFPRPLHILPYRLIGSSFCGPNKWQNGYVDWLYPQELYFLTSTLVAKVGEIL